LHNLTTPTWCCFNQRASTECSGSNATFPKVSGMLCCAGRPCSKLVAWSNLLKMLAKPASAWIGQRPWHP